MKMSNRFVALENLHDSKDTNKAWENIKENIKISAKDNLCLYEWKQHKPWSDDKHSSLLDQRKQAKMQWLRDPNLSNAGNLNNVRCEARRHFRNKKKEYLKAKIYEL